MNVGNLFPQCTPQFLVYVMGRRKTGKKKVKWQEIKRNIRRKCSRKKMKEKNRCILIITFCWTTGDVLSGKQNGGEVHLGILQQWFGIHWWNSREFALLFTLVFVMLPLVLYKRVGECYNWIFCYITCFLVYLELKSFSN